MNTSGVCRRILLALAILGIGFAVVYATPGDSPENPIESPGSDNDGDGEEDESTDVDSASATDWDYVYVHNNSGKDGNGGTSASKVEVTAKSADDKGKGEEGKRRGRVVVDKVQKWNKTTEEWEDVTDTKEPAGGKGEKVVVGLDQTVAHCDKVRIKVRVEVTKKQRVSTGHSLKWEWDENGWAAESGTKVECNFRLLRGNGEQLFRNGAGDDPFGPGMLATVADAFSDLDPSVNLSATIVPEGDSGEYAAPDLVFSERGGWRIPTGTLKFFATGGISLTAGEGLSIVARDENGDNAVTGGLVSFGTPSVTSGVIHVPVTYRDSESELKVAVMVRGAGVQVPLLSGGTLIGYAIGGTSSDSGTVRIPPLLRVGAAPSGTVTSGSTQVEFTYNDGEEPGPTTDSVGNSVLVARPYTGTHQGYLDAIVLNESSAGVFREGSFVIQPVDGFSFVETEDTKLYAVNSDDYSGVTGAFDSATIEVTASGALKVTLGERQTLDTVLQLVILNPKVNLGQAPYTAGQNARVAIGGDALRQPLDRTVLLVEGMPGTEEYSRLLPSVPLAPTQITALAEIETE